MPSRTFVDSNVLIYAFDEAQQRKRLRANQVLNDLWLENSGALSVQVLQEFYYNVTRKMRTPVSRSMAHKVIDHYAEWCGQTSALEVKAALAIQARNHISFWDALIVASALERNATRILSEDLNHGQIIEGVEIINPFLPL